MQRVLPRGQRRIIPRASSLAKVSPKVPRERGYIPETVAQVSAAVTVGRCPGRHRDRDLPRTDRITGRSHPLRGFRPCPAFGNATEDGIHSENDRRSSQEAPEQAGKHQEADCKTETGDCPADVLKYRQAGPTDQADSMVLQSPGRDGASCRRDSSREVGKPEPNAENGNEPTQGTASRFQPSH